MPFDQRSLVHWQASFPRCDRHTYIQTDKLTCRLQWPRGKLSENCMNLDNVQPSLTTHPPPLPVDTLYFWITLREIGWF